MPEHKLTLPSSAKQDWTLFLDRDGVINRRVVDGYVTSVDDLDLLPGATRAIAQLSTLFSRVFVVTNQRGIARGLYAMADVQKMHKRILDDVRVLGGKIDQFYVCPHDHSDHCDCRKPLPGMGYQAKRDFPEIDFARSVMVGDSESDMQFGAALGMTLVWVGPEPLQGTKVNAHVSALEELPAMLV